MIIIEDMLSADEVALYRQVLKTVPWQVGKSTAMGMAANVKQNSQAKHDDKRVQQLGNELLSRIGSTPKLVSSALPQRIFPPVFNRYQQSQTYGFHVDAAIMRIPNSAEVMRSDVSMTLFLSEAHEYEGGELIIDTEFGEQKIKLSAGSAVVYPSSSLHKVTPVTSGERLAAITWMQSMLADANLRKTLFDLDQSIQGLIAKKQADREELDNLHKVYHNLIRHFTIV